MLRRTIPIGTLAFLVTVGFLAGCGDIESPAPFEPGKGDSPAGESGEQAKQAVARQEVESSVETTAEESSDKLRCSEEEKREREEVRLGDFEPPEDVPEYEIVEENPAEKYGARTTRLLVDTRARSEEDYALITRDIKHKYAELDGLGIEFTDTTDTLSYNGGAVIFNTPCGSDYMGYIHHPPNREGYHVIVAKD